MEPRRSVGRVAGVLSVLSLTAVARAQEPVLPACSRSTSPCRTTLSTWAPGSSPTEAVELRPGVGYGLWLMTEASQSISDCIDCDSRRPDRVLTFSAVTGWGP